MTYDRNPSSGNHWTNIEFRPDTSFPFLKITREFGVPYEKVLDIATALEILGDLDTSESLIGAVMKAVNSEHSRREGSSA